MKLCEFPIDQEWRLLYRASVDGFSRYIFHQKCDYNVNTLLIIKSSSGRIFGGYTTAQWNEPIEDYDDDELMAMINFNNNAAEDFFKQDPNSFIFSLINEEKQPIKMKIKEDFKKYAINCGLKHGVGFGRLGDLSLGFDKDDLSKGLSNLGSSFAIPAFVIKPHIFLAGSKCFNVSDFEVYVKC
jgi:hypothetical protein